LQYTAKRLVALPILLLVGLLMSVGNAGAISAPIHISGTAGEGVFIRSGPSTSYTRIGWMPEGASPDYNCFVWGESINGVPIWFNVNYNGVNGYYASFYDDSSYQSNEELTAKYGINLCGSPAAGAPPSAPPPPAAAPPSAPPASAPPTSPLPTAPPKPAAVYFSPYKQGVENGRFEFNDGSTNLLYVNQWQTKCNRPQPEWEPDNGYWAAVHGVPDRPITTLAGWSDGRVGVMSYLGRAGKQRLQQLTYVLLIDPGAYGEMDCERKRKVGNAIVNWLRTSPEGHLVIISTSEVTQLEDSRGIQETYFNSIRNSIRQEGGDLNSRVLTCNYDMKKTAQDTGHEKAFFSSWYWIQHQIGKTRSACPWLSLRGTQYEATAGWHPIN
jgi:uncharacterized protein YraI